MFAPPVMQRLVGDRLHLSHGPIDVVVKAWGTPAAVRAAYAAACRRFPAILPELCDELRQLRRPIDAGPLVASPVARRMAEACLPFRGVFVTPMAAVAGAVADELMAAMVAAAPLQRAFVNDGGDIALLTSEGHALTIGIAGKHSRHAPPAINASLVIDAASRIGGVATSGARGRSFSLGIADAVTTLAGNAATADVAATLIANAVNIDSPRIVRVPACELDPDSDLGDRPVTTCVGCLADAEVAAALARGERQARRYLQLRLIAAAALMLAGQARALGSPALLLGSAPQERLPARRVACRPRQAMRPANAVHRRVTRRPRQ
jgi:ApbE superfamily uncharacterized protein (UPF0280 family)